MDLVNEQLRQPVVTSADRRLRPSPKRPREEHVDGEPLWMERPAIREVLDTETGQHSAVQAVLGTNYERLVRLRMNVRTRMRNDEPLYRCSICSVPVHICRSHKRQRFFFKHKIEDGSCPAVTSQGLTEEEINARKYNGAKESLLHQRMKTWLAKCLEAAPAFTDVAVEATWKGPLTGEWRRPDVCAFYNGIRVAFEVQLSTTFLDVIAARREFYLREGGLLFWVFAEFEPDRRRMTDDDVFFNNNLNAFVVNPATVEASLEKQALCLEAVWVVPTAAESVSGFHRKLVSFAELTLDPVQQRAFYFDFDGAKARLRSAEDIRRRSLRADFEAWLEGDESNPDERRQQWLALRARLAREGVRCGPEVGDVPRSLLNALYAAKYGRPFNQRRHLFIEQAHLVLHSRKSDVLWFSYALKCYERAAQLHAEDKKGRWKKKVAAIRVLRKQDPDQFSPREEFRLLVEFLFPELGRLPDASENTTAGVAAYPRHASAVGQQARSDASSNSKFGAERRQNDLNKNGTGGHHDGQPGMRSQ